MLLLLCILSFFSSSGWNALTSSPTRRVVQPQRALLEKSGPEKYCTNLDKDLEEDVSFEDSLEDMNEFSITLGVLLALGAMLSVVPQHIKMWKTRSSEGLSFYMLFLGNICQFSSALNAIILKFPQLEACGEVGVVKCSPSLLTIYQLVGVWMVTFPVYWWFLLFYLRTDSFKKNMGKRRRDFIIAWLLFAFFVAYVGLTSLLAGVFIGALGDCAQTTIDYGWSMGMLSTATTFVQWLPQIYKTWRIKSVGSFSILTLGIQAPGTMIMVYFLLFLAGESVSTWLAYFTAGCQQLVLLALLMYYNFKNKLPCFRKPEIQDDEEHPKKIDDPVKSEDKQTGGDVENNEKSRLFDGENWDRYEYYSLHEDDIPG